MAAGTAAMERLLARSSVPELAERYVAVFRREIPSIARLPGEFTEPLLANVAGTIALTRRWIVQATAGPTGDPDVTALLDLPRAAAAAGMPLEDLLRTYYLGSREGLAVLRETSRPSEANLMALASGVIVRACDVIATAVATMYLHERPDLLDSDEQHARALLDAVLSGAALTKANHITAERIGLPIAEAYRTFAACRPGGAAYHHAELARSLRATAVLAVADGASVHGLTTGPRVPTGDGTLLVLGPPTERSALADALQETRRALRLARDERRTGLVDVDEYLPELLMASAPRLARRLTENTVQRLDGHPELAETLAAYLGNQLDNSRTAAQLCVHRNTLLHRLHRIAALTGRDLRDPRDIAVLYLAGRAAQR